jgi:hypothetical protein
MKLVFVDESGFDLLSGVVKSGERLHFAHCGSGNFQTNPPRQQGFRWRSAHSRVRLV